MSTEIKNHNKIQAKRLTWRTVCDIVTVQIVIKKITVQHIRNEGEA